MKIQILYLGNQLAKHGYNKTTIETLGPALEEEGYTVYYRSDKKAFLFRLLDMVKAIIHYSNKIDYILIDTYSTKAFWFAFIGSQFAHVLKVKYIPILHGGNLPNRLKRNPFLSRLLFKYAYKNVAPSGYLKHEFEKAGFKNVIHVPNAIEIQKYAFKPRTELAPKLLWVRAFATIYNPKMAVDVLVALQQSFPNASLTMVGPDKDGSLHATKNYAISKGVEVTFTGQLSQENWCKLAAAHDIFINTTHFDNTPISVMEAMALGLAVVSTNVGGIPYLVTDEVDALLVNENDALEMTQSIIRLLTKPAVAVSLTQNASVRIKQLDWNLVKQQWMQILH
ncbi:glycosyltransferase family 4 protein [Flavobacterium psychraquaticum]|uniref:glycosyltransferase family 4 protein n=1 Tax=Flavobacterium psychraquaticum TaxID=3103958 RepID=UPI002ACE65AC|nr:glycosyltransferase family 4 protein [Flavobacterium sp. LB-N7T]